MPGPAPTGSSPSYRISRRLRLSGGAVPAALFGVVHRALPAAGLRSRSLFVHGRIRYVRSSRFLASRTAPSALSNPVGGSNALFGTDRLDPDSPRRSVSAWARGFAGFVLASRSLGCRFSGWSVPDGRCCGGGLLAAFLPVDRGTILFVPRPQLLGCQPLLLGAGRAAGLPVVYVRSSVRDRAHVRWCPVSRTRAPPFFSTAIPVVVAVADGGVLELAARRPGCCRGPLLVYPGFP